MGLLLGAVGEVQQVGQGQSSGVREGSGVGSGLCYTVGLLLGAVGEVQQVGHGHKGVCQGLHGRDALVCVQRQHLLQEVDELPPVRLLRQHVRPLQVRGHVHLDARADAGVRLQKSSPTITLTVKCIHASPIRLFK